MCNYTERFLKINDKGFTPKGHREEKKYDIGKVEVGQMMEIETEALPGRKFKGLVEKIAPVAKRMSTGQTTETIIPVTIKVQEVDEILKPGFSVRTRIISEEKENALVVPFDSIITEANGAKVVFVVREDILHKEEVRIGRAKG